MEADSICDRFDVDKKALTDLEDFHAYLRYGNVKTAFTTLEPLDAPKTLPDWIEPVVSNDADFLANGWI